MERHRRALIPEGTRRRSRAGVTPARRSPDSGSAPWGPLCHGFRSAWGCQDVDERTVWERAGVGGAGACGSLTPAPGAEGASTPAERPPVSLTVPTRPRASRLSRSGRVSHTPPRRPLPVTPTLPKLARTGRRSGRALGLTRTPVLPSSVWLFLLGSHYFLISPISVSSADAAFFNLQLRAAGREAFTARLASLITAK